MSTIWVFHYIENKHTLYRGKDRMGKFCKPLIEHAKNIIDFENKNIVTVDKRRTKITWTCKSMLYSWKKNLENVISKFKLLES